MKGVSNVRQDSAFAFPHGILVVDEDGVGVVDDPVQNGNRQRVLADLGMPAGRAELRAENGGALLVAGLHDFQKITGFTVRERHQQPFVQDEQADLLVLSYHLSR